MNMFKKNGGFTLVELIVVIAILAILAGVAIPAYTGYIAKANEATDYQMLGAVKTAVIFAAVEADAGHDCEVKSAIVGTDAKTVKVKGDNLTIGEQTADKDGYYTVDISAYVGETLSYKTTDITGATWNGTEWKLTK